MSVRFDGTTTGNYLDSGDLFYSPTITISCWFKSYSISSAIKNLIVKRNIGIANSGNPEYDIFTASGKLAFQAFDSSDAAVFSFTGASTLSNFVWYHFVAVSRGANNLAEVYLNGNSDGSATQTANSIQNSTNSIQAGVRSGNNTARYWNGEISEVAIWNVALNPNEIKILASGVKRQPLQIQREYLQVYLPMDDYPQGTLSSNGDTYKNLGLTGTPFTVAQAAATGPFQTKEILTYP